MAGADVVKSWFFSETPEKSAYGFGRHGFAQWLAPDSQRKLLQSIVLDPRIEQLDAYTLVLLIGSANKSLGRTIVSNKDLHELNGYPRDLIERLGKAEAERREPVRIKAHQILVTGTLEKLRAAFPK